MQRKRLTIVGSEAQLDKFSGDRRGSNGGGVDLVRNRPWSPGAKRESTPRMAIEIIPYGCKLHVKSNNWERDYIKLIIMHTSF